MTDADILDDAREPCRRSGQVFLLFKLTLAKTADGWNCAGRGLTPKGGSRTTRSEFVVAASVRT